LTVFSRNFFLDLEGGAVVSLLCDLIEVSVSPRLCSRFPNSFRLILLIWNGMGRCTPADCSRRASSRRWHFLCRKRRGLRATRRAGIPEKRSQWGLATFPGSGARLSCHQRSNRESGLPVQYCSGSGELIGLSGRTPHYFSTLCNFEQPERPPSS
jgi:hypothetical protein